MIVRYRFSMPLFFNPADFEDFSFKIIKMEEIKDLSTVLNLPAQEEDKQERKELAYVG